MAFRPSEKATLIVKGKRYEDWTSVSITHRTTEAYPIAVFECTEAIPVPTAWPELQIKPGDPCVIKLAGIPAVAGVVIARQTVTSAEAHGVQITVWGKTADLVYSSVVSSNGNYDGYSWLAIAKALCAPFGIGVKVVGNLDATPFPQMQIQPGELVWSVLERLARSRKIVLGSDEFGNIVAIGEHGAELTDRLVEGQNILSMSCLIQDIHVYSKIYAIGQTAGGNESWGSDVSEISAEVAGSAQRYRPLVVTADHPENQRGLQRRAEFEKLFGEGAQVNAQVTVQGWLRGNADLWRVRTCPIVWAPSHALSNITLAIEEATFRQDNSSGTTTTLTLVLPDRLNATKIFSPERNPAPSAAT